LKEAIVVRARLVVLAFALIRLRQMIVHKRIIRIQPEDAIVLRDGTKGIEF
jgi:hypothetical protein